tara:strand:+ start:2884 stop:3783 length:900 start_codon:yes stop_codon:yes gene_type:complete
MSESNKEKSLIELAREHMEKEGIDPNQGMSVPDMPASTDKVQREKPEEAPQVLDAFDGKISDAVGDLLSNVDTSMEWRTLNLPSRGKAYIQSDGTVEIKAFTFAQEKTLRSIKSEADGSRVIKKLFKDCVKGLDYDSMTVEDKTYILFKLREISYGNDYTITAVCPSCEANNSLVIEIDKVPVEYAPDDYEEPFTITLPDSKQEVQFVSPRSKDEHMLTDIETLLDNLYMFALSVGKYSDERIRREFFKKTTVKDVAFFRENLLKDRYGMNKTMSYNCANCNALNEMVIPLNESFFSVS